MGKNSISPGGGRNHFAGKLEERMRLFVIVLLPKLLLAQDKKMDRRKKKIGGGPQCQRRDGLKKAK